MSIEKEEVWKPVPSCPGLMASSWGRLKLPDRHNVPLPNGGTRSYLAKPVKGTIIWKNKGTYPVRNYTTREFGNVKIHRAVCEAFHGPSPFEGAVVMHIDDDPLNNVPSNLKWGTQKENLNSEAFLKYCRERVHPSLKRK